VCVCTTKPLKQRASCRYQSLSNSTYHAGIKDLQTACIMQALIVDCNLNTLQCTSFAAGGLIVLVLEIYREPSHTPTHPRASMLHAYTHTHTCTNIFLHTYLHTYIYTYIRLYRGKARRFGSRRHYSTSSKTYREHTERICSAMAER
jgi:hypothetical protein